MKKDFLLPSFSSEDSYPSEENPVRSTPQSGSILVEAIVMIGLISALTPVLYKHVSDRRSEIEDINKANTFLLIQRETERYLKENRGNVASGLLPLSNIGLARLDSKYVIGIRKQDDDVYAMIAEKEASNGGNDMKAGKVASLIGVSAGIYSAINSANAYGINGVWIEAVSDYGLNGVLPTGSVVVTTQYNQEKQKFYSSDIDWSDGDNVTITAAKGVFGQVCIGNADNCVTSWDEVEGAAAGDINLTLCQQEMASGLGYSSFCSAVEDIIQDCESISEYYKGRGFQASSKYYWLGANANNLTKTSCYFVNGEMPTNTEIVTGCNTDNEIRKYACNYDYETNWLTKNCTTIGSVDNSLTTGFYTFATGSGENAYSINEPCVYDETMQSLITKCNEQGLNSVYCKYGIKNNITDTCANIIANWNTAPTGYYTTTTVNKPCVFYNKAVANNEQVITQCNADTTTNHTGVACHYAYEVGLNNTCAAIAAAWSAAPTGWYNKYSTEGNFPCAFNGGAVATASQTVTQCDSAKVITNAACKIALTNAWNTSCAAVIAAGTVAGVHYITTDSGTSYVANNCCTTNGNCASDSNGHICNNSTKLCWCGGVNANCSSNQVCSAKTSYCITCSDANCTSDLNATAYCRNSYNSTGTVGLKVCTKCSIGNGATVLSNTSVVTGTSTGVANITSYTIPANCTGVYKITLKGQSGIINSYGGHSGNGGILWAVNALATGNVMLFKRVSGGVWVWTYYQAGAGICMWLNNVLKLCAGGGGCERVSGGGGYIGGTATIDGGYINGFSYDGSRGASTAWCNSGCTYNANGGRGYYATGPSYGGTGYCSGFNCTYQGGGNSTWTATSWSFEYYGNYGNGSLAVQYLGPQS